MLASLRCGLSHAYVSHTHLKANPTLGVMAPGSFPLISSRFPPSDIVMKGSGANTIIYRLHLRQVKNTSQSFVSGSQVQVSGLVSCVG